MRFSPSSHPYFENHAKAIYKAVNPKELNCGVELGLIDVESVSCATGSINMWRRSLLVFQVEISLSGIHRQPLLELAAHPQSSHVSKALLPFRDTTRLVY